MPLSGTLPAALVSSLRFRARGSRSHRLRAGVAVAGLVSLLSAPASASFTRLGIDEEQAPWGKALADLDGDGFVDIVEGGPNLDGGVFWYRYPDWSRFQIASSGGGDDLVAADIDGDGDLDVVTNRNPIGWHENPRVGGGDPTQTWTGHTIDSGRSHDLAVADVDRDGRLDVVARSASADAGGLSRIYFQDGPDAWAEVELTQALVAEGGLALADIDRDGRLDVIGNGYWLEQPSDARDGSGWQRHTIGDWPAGSSIAAADLDHDGRIDVTLAASETGPGEFAWFEAPPVPETGIWQRHVIDDPVEDVHRHRLVDVDDDGELDIVFAEMHQSPGRRIGIYHNQGAGSAFHLELLATTGSHNVAVGDVGSDGDIDILGANWSTAAPDGGRLDLWRNDRTSRGRAQLDAWTYVQVTGEKPDRAFGLAFADLNGDGRTDVVSGRSWYRNPGGDLTAEWLRTDLGGDFDAMLALDVDGNGQQDLIAQGPPSDGTVPVFWLRPDDAAASTFTPHEVGSIPADPADGRSQGYALGQLVPGGPPTIVMSSVGLHLLEVPAAPAVDAWPQTEITSEALEEGIALGDIDADGDLDVAAVAAPGGGTTLAWWENTGGSWPRHDVGTTPGGIVADRVALADVDWDGKLDLVATETSLTGTGNALFWFRQPDAAGPWIRQTIAGNLGSLNSLDVGDMDGDGRPDVVAGEHRGALRVTAWKNLDGGENWQAFAIDEGKESHLGTRLADLSGDGAPDVVSIAFDQPQDIHLWVVDSVPEPGASAALLTAGLTLAALRRTRRGRPRAARRRSLPIFPLGCRPPR